MGRHRLRLAVKRLSQQTNDAAQLTERALRRLPSSQALRRIQWKAMLSASLPSSGFTEVVAIHREAV
jgi:hypothetical protein